MAEQDHEETQVSTGGVDSALARHGGLPYPEIPTKE